MKLKELRGTKTQEELAKLLNLSQKTYSNYENGNSEPNIETLCKIADFYGVSLDYLCDHKTQLSFDVGFLNDNQKQLLTLTKQLNEENTLKAIGYLNGLIDTQK